MSKCYFSQSYPLGAEHGNGHINAHTQVDIQVHLLHTRKKIIIIFFKKYIGLISGFGNSLVVRFVLRKLTMITFLNSSVIDYSIAYTVVTTLRTISSSNDTQVNNREMQF